MVESLPNMQKAWSSVPTPREEEEGGGRER